MAAPLHYNASNPNGAILQHVRVQYWFRASSLRTTIGPFPALFNNLRIDSMNNFNVNVSKSFVIHENLKMQFRAESDNLCNRPLFESPNQTVTASTFGYITSTTNVAPGDPARAAADFLRWAKFVPGRSPGSAGWTSRRLPATDKPPAARPPALPHRPARSGQPP